MLNFNFSENGLGLVSSSHFACDCSRKMFLMVHSINWPNFFVWLPLMLKIFGNMCITIKSFCYMTKTSRQKLKYPENEKSLLVEIRSIFIIFKWLSVVKNCLRPESAPLRKRGGLVYAAGIDAKSLAWSKKPLLFLTVPQMTFKLTKEPLTCNSNYIAYLTKF